MYLLFSPQLFVILLLFITYTYFDHCCCRGGILFPLAHAVIYTCSERTCINRMPIIQDVSLFVTVRVPFGPHRKNVVFIQNTFHTQAAYTRFEHYFYRVDITDV